MSIDRSPLRIVPVTGVARPPSLVRPLEAALRLAGSDRGALVHRRHAEAAVLVTGLNLSPEEEAACLSLARRAWQHPARSGALASSLGGSTLLAEPIDAGDGDGAFVIAVPGGSGKVGAERLAVLHDVAALLAVTLSSAVQSERASAHAAEERRRAERVLALNHALQALADTEDVGAACSNLLAELDPQFAGVDLTLIWLLEPDGSRLRMVAARGLHAGDDLAPIIPLGMALGADAVVTSGEMRFLEFARGAARSRSMKLARRLGLSSVLHVPLRSRNSVTGILMLGSYATREFDADERLFLETLGAQLGGQLDAIRQLEAAEAEQKRLQALIETLPVGIVIFDAAGRVTLHNRAIAAIWGQRPTDTKIGERLEMAGLFSADGRLLAPQESPLARAIRAEGTHYSQELIVRRSKTGEEVPVLVNAAPIRDSQDRLTGVITVYQDITQLREVDRLKDEFINTVSHELRTPTTTVRGGALTLLKRGDQLEPAVRRQLLRDMADEAERLYHLVEDLLSLSRVQAGMQVQAEPLIVHRFVNKVILDLGGKVGNHALTVDVSADLPMVDANPSHLEQVLRNLLENAVKFSPKGRRIEIAVKARGPSVLFSVLDQGSGIPAEDMDRVFEPFYKTAEAVRTGSQGAGLGLAVSRRLIEIQGGRIWAEARAGGGTAFRFTLPALPDEGEE